MSIIEKLTPASQELFVAIIKNLGNWSGTPPCFDHITPATRGNLTHLKRLGLVSTFKSDGEEWIDIKADGVRVAVKLGLGSYLADRELNELLGELKGTHDVKVAWEPRGDSSVYTFNGTAFPNDEAGRNLRAETVLAFVNFFRPHQAFLA